MSSGDWVRINDNTAQVEFGTGNGVAKIIADGPGSLEVRFAALNNSASLCHWRMLFNATGQLEVQRASDDTFSDAKNILSLAGGSINVNIDDYGVNTDSARAGNYSNINFRNSDGSQIRGQVACGPSPLNSAQPALYFSALDPSGTLKPCMVIGPRDGMTASTTDANDNPIAFWVGGGWHRLRRSGTTATLS
jgi:hypothetical protein